MTRGLLFAISVMAGLTGVAACARIEQDVSDEARYSSQIGETCRTVAPLYAYGWKDLGSDSDAVREVDLVDGRIGGPEIVFEVDVPIGTMLVIRRVRRCVNCPTGRIKYRVDVEGIEAVAPYEVWARDHAMTPKHVACKRREG